MDFACSISNRNLYVVNLIYARLRNAQRIIGPPEPSRIEPRAFAFSLHAETRAQRCSKSQAIPKHLGVDIACSMSCAPGNRTCSIILTSTASSRQAAVRSMATDGLLLLPVFPAHPCSQSRLSRQVRGYAEAPLASSQAPVSRFGPEACETRALPPVPATLPHPRPAQGLGPQSLC
jgi:hypothetical protein